MLCQKEEPALLHGFMVIRSWQALFTHPAVLIRTFDLYRIELYHLAV